MVETVAIIDHGSGNLRSAAKSFERAAAGLIGGTPRIVVTADPETVSTADRVVLPGVGTFADCRIGLKAVPGLESALIEAVRVRAVPFLGICVGMQLMASRGLEHGETAGLDWIEGDVVPIRPDDPRGLKIPHMGWNVLDVRVQHPVLRDLPSGCHVYFVHSYRFRLSRDDRLLATSAHGEVLAAAIGQDNLVGTQFHPEKSQGAGLALISNFLNWYPA